MFLFLFWYFFTDTAGDILCPGQRVSYSCSASTSIHWMGSAFNGMCPSVNDITLLAANSTEGGNIGCGVFNATITSITGFDIASNLTFTATSALPIDGSHIVCRDANLQIVEAYAINIQCERNYQNVLHTTSCWSQSS